MSDCGQIVEKTYLSSQVENLISKVEPVDLRDDLRQEVAMALLKQPCDKLVTLHSEGKLIYFTIRIVQNMAFSAKSPFYNVYRKKHIKKAIEYLYCQTDGFSSVAQINDESLEIRHKSEQAEELKVNTINQLVNSKMAGTEYEAHESMIFQAYTQLGSCRNVSNYFKIPVHHVKKVVASVKQELKEQVCKLS